MPDTIGDRIRQLRRRLGLTERDLGELVGVTMQHISRIEKGLSGPSLDLLVRISQELGVTSDYLLTGVRITDETIRNVTIGAIKRDVARIRKRLEELK